MIMQSESVPLSGCRGVETFDRPPGTVLQAATINASGATELHWGAPDCDSGATKKPCKVLFLWSGDPADGGDPRDWRHISSLTYPNGRRQHVFAEVAPVAKSRPKKPARSALTD